MSFLKRMFSAATNGGRQAGNSQLPASQLSLPASSQQSLSPLAQQNASRRELLRVVLRDVLNRNGIPTAWIGVDLLAATSRGREPGIHVRLLLKHWDPRLMLHGVAFQTSYYKRVLTLDPLADRWLLGISWQFALPDDKKCPQMPHPGTWTASFPTAAAAAAASTAAAVATAHAMTAPDPADVLGGSIVISGPAAAPDSSAGRPASAAAIEPSDTAARAEARADLERLFAVRDADMKLHSEAGEGGTFAATEPAGLTELPQAAPVPADGGLLQATFAKTDVFWRPAQAAPDKPVTQ